MPEQRPGPPGPRGPPDSVRCPRSTLPPAGLPQPPAHASAHWVSVCVRGSGREVMAPVALVRSSLDEATRGQLRVANTFVFPSPEAVRVDVCVWIFIYAPALANVRTGGGVLSD